LKLDIYHNEDEGRNFRLVDFQGSESLGSKVNTSNNNVKSLFPIRQCPVEELCLHIYCKMFDDFGVGSWIGIGKFSVNDSGVIFNGSV
jgi:hypothetical protein